MRAVYLVSILIILVGLFLVAMKHLSWIAELIMTHMDLQASEG